MLSIIIAIALIAYIVFWVLGAISLPEPVRLVAYVIVGVIIILALLGQLPGGNRLF